MKIEGSVRVFVLLPVKWPLSGEKKISEANKQTTMMMMGELVFLQCLASVVFFKYLHTCMDKMLREDLLLCILKGRLHVRTIACPIC
jgi:hypothetical protein